MKNCRPAYMIRLYNRRKKVQELADAMNQLGINSPAEAKCELRRLTAEIREVERQVLGPVRYKDDPKAREDTSVRIVPQPRRSNNNH